MFDGLFSKKISFSYYITHQTAYWNISSDMFQLKPAQAEKMNVWLQQIK